MIELLDIRPGTVETWLQRNRDLICKYLANYFTLNEGRHFESFCLQSDDVTFTSWDFLALSALSVNPKATAIREVLVERHDEFNQALVRAREAVCAEPKGARELWTIDSKVLQPGKELSKLYEMLKSVNGIGYVSASKLLAAKFPDLVPIRDSKVEKLLQAGTAWWEPMARVMRSDIVKQILNDSMPELSVQQPSPGLLRRLDVILWKHADVQGL